MTIRKRLIISNIWMLVLPIIFMFAITLLGLSTFGQKYLQSMSTFHEEEDLGITKVPYAISFYKGQLKQQESEPALEDFKQTMAGMGYHLAVSGNGVKLSDTLTEKDQQLIDIHLNEQLGAADDVSVYIEPAHIFKSNFTINDTDFSIIGVNATGQTGRMNFSSSAHLYFSSFFMFIFISTLVFIVLTNVFLTSRVTKRLLTPLNLLSRGAREIRDGNLDYVLDYRGNDEFGQVCSDFNEMRDRLKESVQTQLKYEEGRKDLLAGISHDLRTPLTTIKGYVEGITDGVADTPEKQQKYLQTIYNKADDMDVLVDKLFLFSKLDTGQFPFHFERVDMNGYIKDFVASIQDEFSQRGLEIKLETSTEQPLQVTIDRAEMSRVFTNILENSRKYSQIDKVTVTFSIEKVQQQARLTIKDNGHGVADENLQHIFTNFFREDTSRSNPENGNGLGLAIAKSIVEGHGGSIEAANQNGLSITIHLPIVEDQRKEGQS